MPTRRVNSAVRPLMTRCSPVRSSAWAELGRAWTSSWRRASRSVWRPWTGEVGVERASTAMPCEPMFDYTEIGLAGSRLLDLGQELQDVPLELLRPLEAGDVRHAV